jgi:hypothetical protein
MRKVLPASRGPWSSPASDRYMQSHSQTWKHTVNQFAAVLYHAPAIDDADGRQALRFLFKRFAHMCDCAKIHTAVKEAPCSPDEIVHTFMNELGDALARTGVLGNRDARNTLAEACVQFAEVLANAEVPDELWERVHESGAPDEPPAERIRAIFRTDTRLRGESEDDDSEEVP